MLHDDANALDCHLAGITLKFHPSSSPLPPSVPSTPSSESDTSSPDFNRTESLRSQVRKEMSIKEEVKQLLQLVTTYICKQELPRAPKLSERSILGKESMLLQVFNLNLFTSYVVFNLNLLDSAILENTLFANRTIGNIHY